MPKRNKFLLYSFLSLILMFSLGFFFTPRSDYSFLETSFLTILKRMAEEGKPAPPDLSIENVSLKKVSDPIDNFNFYKYDASVVFKNYGGSFKNAQVTLNYGDDQSSVFVKNTPKGFSLEEGQTFIFEDYNVIFDGNYNGGEITLEAKMTDRAEYFQDNNVYSVPVFELPAKIQSIGIEEILEDATFVLHFTPENFILDNYDFEIAISDSADFDPEEQRYDEVYGLGKFYGYHRIKNSQSTVEASNWKAKRTSALESHFLKFSDDPFNDEASHYAYIKITNPENGNYAVSNIVKFSPQKELTRAAFAKLFVDYTGVGVFNDGELYYEDISLDAWYGPYIQTVYNLGLINSTSDKFYPDDPINRGEVLRVVLDYFDADLRISDGAPHFEDVPEDSYFYPYVEALYADGVASIFRGVFNSEQTATRNYLKYLINEYKEDS